MNTQLACCFLYHVVRKFQEQIYSKLTHKKGTKLLTKIGDLYDEWIHGESSNLHLFNIPGIFLTNVFMVYLCCCIYFQIGGTTVSWYMHPMMDLKSVLIRCTLDLREIGFPGIPSSFHILQNWVTNIIMVCAPHYIPKICTFAMYPELT